MCVSGVQALTKDTEVKGILSSGAVEIDLKTYTISDGSEVIYTEENKHVMPGSEISLIPRVSNKAEACYLRAKIEINDESLCSVDGITSNWTKKGDYYYLTNVFAKDATVDLFTKVKISDNVSQGSENETIIVKVTVEAIQDKNFEPDYSLEDPWKGVEIEKCIEKTYSVDDEDATTVTYQPDSIEVTSDFFNDLDTLMPGDEITGTVKIKNKHSKNSEIFMDIVQDDLDDEADELLKSLIIKIDDENGNTIYEGNVYDFPITSLGEFSSGQEKSLTFKMVVPPELTNEYSKINSKLNWIFYTEDEEEPVKPDEPEEQKEKPEEKQSYKHPKTGDTKIDISLLVFYTSAICLIIVIVLGFIERKKNS